MSVTELSTRTPTARVERSLCGWGRTARSRCRVFQPCEPQDVVDVLASEAHAERGVIARGAGRSYGDAAQNDGGDVLDMTGLDRIVSIDGERGLVTAQAGVTIAKLMAGLSAHGLTLPVVPGSRHDGQREPVGREPSHQLGDRHAGLRGYQPALAVDRDDPVQTGHVQHIAAIVLSGIAIAA